MYRINVLIVTYKQADVIGRNIESILQQKEFGLNKIIICDDHSPDNNWEVIQNYVRQYPNYIEAYHNDVNLGIYGNSNKLMSLRGDSDLYCWLEGDDALCEGYLKTIQEYLINNSIDINAPIGLFSGYKSVSPTGAIEYIRNDYFLKHPTKNPFGAYCRGYVSWRSGVFSKSVLSRFEPVILERGLSLAEFLFDGQWFRHVNRCYYVEAFGSIYYSGIGVSTELAKTDYRKKEAIIQWEYYINNFAESLFDRLWAKSKLIRANYSISKPYGVKRLYYILSFCFYSIVGMIPYGINWKRLVTGVYVMIKA